MSVHVEIIGAKDVMVYFSSLPGLTRKSLTRQITRFVIQLQKYAKQNKLSGRPGLNVHTNLLRSSLSYEVKDLGDAIEGMVGTNVAYAGVHEFGFKGTVTVKEHMRRNKASFKAAGKAGFKGKEKKAQSRTSAMGASVVHSFTRQMNIPERSFLRSSLRELTSDFQNQMKLAVVQATKGSK